jgi:hypothetical protein
LLLDVAKKIAPASSNDLLSAPFSITCTKQLRKKPIKINYQPVKKFPSGLPPICHPTDKIRKREPSATGSRSSNRHG